MAANDEVKRIENILDTITSENMGEYSNDPIFHSNGVVPKGLSKEYQQKWQQWNYKINKDKGSKRSGSGNGDVDAIGSSTVSKDNKSNEVTGESTETTPTAGQKTASETKSALKEYDTKDFKNGVKASRKETNDYNNKMAEKYEVDPLTGNSNNWRSLSILNKEKNQAEDDLESAKKNNQTIAENTAKKDSVESALNASKKIKGKWDGVNKSVQKALGKKKKELENDFAGGTSEEISESLNQTDAQINAVQREIDNAKQWSEAIDNPGLKAHIDELTNLQGNLALQREELAKQLETAQSLEGLTDQINTFKENQKSVTADSIGALGKWIDENGTEDDKKRFEAMTSMWDAITAIDEDGTITPEEVKQLNQIIEDCDNAIEQEIRNDPTVSEKQKNYDNAKAKFSYYLFNQIVSIAAMLIGASVGSPNVIMTALDQFNKQISNAEAGYRVANINAVSNNAVNEITTPSDVQRAKEMIEPELDKAIQERKITEDDKVRAMRAMEKAFQEYQNYVSEGGNEDFAVWYSAQVSGAKDGWASIISTLLSSGALNWDLLKKAFDTSGSGSKPSGKDISLIKGANLNNIFSNALSKGVPSPEQVTADTNMKRDMQGVLMGALQNRLPRNAPQQQPQAKPDLGWGGTQAG